MKTVDPHGVRWTVRRRWLPRYEGRGLRERLRQRRSRAAARRGGDEGRWYDWIDLPFVGDSLTGIVVVVLVIGALTAVVLFGVPLLLALVDLVLVLGAAVIGVVGRVVLRRPWTVEARSSAGERHEVPVVGWRRAGEIVRSTAKDIEEGIPLAPDPTRAP